jgi:phage terminase large subunit-like protein
MIQQSPELASCCTINRGTLQIDYHWTDSTYKVVSGNNVRGQQGLNGSVLIDELHVVSEQLYDALLYAGISRKQPLFLTFSTAGDDVSSLGYKIYDASIQIANGKAYDPSCYVSIFGDFSAWKHPERNRPLSPEDWYDEPIALSLAQKANPAIGSTISLDELTTSYRAATRSQTELARWKKYRCNVWTSGDNGWIVEEYANCCKPFTYRDMFEKKAPCTLAFDLSQTGDSTAATATFAIKDPDSIDKVIPHQITWSWVPEFTAKKRLSQHSINYWDWHNEKDNVFICPGASTVPYQTVGEFIRWFLDYFDCRAIGYDVWNSSQFVNDLVCRHSVPESLLIKIPQNMATMGPFTQALEKRALDKTIVVADSDYMRWQCGNVQLVYDPSMNYKPAKKDRNSPKTVDGIVSSIMSNGIFHLPELELTTEPICSVSMLLPKV